MRLVDPPKNVLSQAQIKRDKAQRSTYSSLKTREDGEGFRGKIVEILGFWIPVRAFVRIKETMGEIRRTAEVNRVYTINALDIDPENDG